MQDDINAFVDGPRAEIAGNAEGPLKGLSFVAKDLFDVAGYPTAGGNPDWASDNPIPDKNAWAVQTLLDAGADLIGKVITDEFSYGILGENAFYGTPLNSAAPDRVPGGSSSGTAAAVGAKICDFGIGTDTGGSVRVPASFCGLYGIRPTHGRLDLSGMMPQAPSSDTTGWLAHAPDTFRRVSGVMLAEEIPPPKLDKLIIAVDAFGFANADVSTVLEPLVEKLGQMASEVVEDVMVPAGISTWGRAQRILQPAEAWGTFKDWVNRCNPRVSFNVARGLMIGSMVTDADKPWATMIRREARARLRYLLPPGTALVMPTTPCPAPKKNLPLDQQNEIRELILGLAGLGGLCGLPQVNVPGALVDGIPVGLSILTGPNEDAAAVALATELGASLS
jgi:amidase